MSRIQRIKTLVRGALFYTAFKIYNNIASQSIELSEENKKLLNTSTYKFLDIATVGVFTNLKKHKMCLENIRNKNYTVQPLEDSNEVIEKYEKRKKFLKTIFNGMLGGLTFGVYHRIVADRQIKEFNEEMEKKIQQLEERMKDKK